MKKCHILKLKLEIKAIKNLEFFKILSNLRLLRRPCFELLYVMD